MECPKCNGCGWLGRVKVLSKNIILRVCNHCSHLWPEGVNPAKHPAMLLKDFLKLKKLKDYDLIDISEETVKAS